MRLRHIALGCTLTGALGLFATPPATAAAESTVRADSSALARTAVNSATLNAMAARAWTADVVTVEGIKPRLSISSSAANYRYGAVVRLTVTLGPTVKDRRVSLYASPYGERRTLVATGDVNAQGKWYPTYPISRKTTLTVVFAGDSYNAPNSAHITLDAYARVADRLTGYFKTARINGLTYNVFRGSGTLTLYSTVTPNKHSECLEPESEQYESGKTWYADTKYGCDTLDSASHDTAPFALNTAVGDKYRIRGDYFRSPKDLGNLNQQGQWLYFEVVK